MAPLLIELDDARIQRLAYRQLGLPRDGHHAMQPVVIVPMICFALRRRCQMMPAGAIQRVDGSITELALFARAALAG